MTDTLFVKAGSDRPDFEVELADDGSTVDLTDADNVQLRLWTGDGTEHLDVSATFAAAAVGLVRYDLDATETVAGSYLAELRVDWSDGDEQWFPIDAPGYPVEITPPPFDRP